VILLFIIRKQKFFALGSGQTIILKTVLLNSGDDAFLPRLTLRFPNHIHYIKVLQNVSSSHADMAVKDRLISEFKISVLVNQVTHSYVLMLTARRPHTYVFRNTTEDQLL